MVSLLNAQAVATALGVASKVGLLAALGPEPATAMALAEAAGLKARYVEEILAVLVTGDVVALLPMEEPPTAAGELRYSLAADRVAALGGMGLYFQELPLLSQCAFAEVCAAARLQPQQPSGGGSGGGGSSEASKATAGVAGSCYEPFGAWMGALADAKHRAQLVDKLLPAIDGGRVVARLRQAAPSLVSGVVRVPTATASGPSSFDAAATATELPAAAAAEMRCIVDLGCGEGAAAILMASAFPDAVVVGVDSRETSVAAARAAALAVVSRTRISSLWPAGLPILQTVTVMETSFDVLLRANQRAKRLVCAWGGHDRGVPT